MKPCRLKESSFLPLLNLQLQPPDGTAPAPAGAYAAPCCWADPKKPPGWEHVVRQKAIGTNIKIVSTITVTVAFITLIVGLATHFHMKGRARDEIAEIQR